MERFKESLMVESSGSDDIVSTEGRDVREVSELSGSDEGEQGSCFIGHKSRWRRTFVGAASESFQTVAFGTLWHRSK